MLLLIGRPGRVVCHEGIDVAVPTDFMIPTCDECGAERWDAERHAALATAVQAARVLARRMAETQEIDVTADRDG